MILVNSAGGCATTMVINYLSEVMPPPDKSVKFQIRDKDKLTLLEQTDRPDLDSPILASSLYYVDPVACELVHQLLDRTTGNVLGLQPLNMSSALKEAAAAQCISLKHVYQPPGANIASNFYGLLGLGSGPGSSGEIYITDDKNLQITKAIYLHADPLDVLSTLFLKRINSGWDATVHDHIVKCSPYSYKQLLYIFKHFPISWNIDDFSNWAYEEQFDPFGLEISFDLWTVTDEKIHSRPELIREVAHKLYPTLIVRYETMWDNLPIIAEFLEADVDSFVAGFPKKRKRKRPWTELDVETRAKLSSLYSSLIKKRSQVSDIFVRR